MSETDNSQPSRWKKWADKAKARLRQLGTRMQRIWRRLFRGTEELSMNPSRDTAPREPVVRKIETNSDGTFRGQVFKDAADFMAKRLKAPPLEIATALCDLADKNSDSPLLEALWRVECEFVKQSPTLVRSTVTVLLRQGEQFRRQTIVREVPWEDLPDEARASFIRNNEKVQCWVVVERPVQKGTE